MAESKRNNDGNGFKNAPLGYDKQDVNAYIANLNKTRLQMELEYKEKIAELQKQVEEAQAASVSEEKLAQINKEHEEKTMELRKLVLDERRHVAQLDKECAKAQISEQQMAKDMDKLRAIAEKQSKELSAYRKNGVPSANGASTEEAYKQAEQIIETAKAYAKEVVIKSNKYKSDVEAKLSEMKKKLEAATMEINVIFKQTLAEADSAKALAGDIPEFDLESLEAETPDMTPTSYFEAEEEQPDSPIFVINSADIPEEKPVENIATMEIPAPVQPQAEILPTADDIFDSIDQPVDNVDETNDEMSTDDIFDDIFGNDDSTDDAVLSTNNVFAIEDQKPQVLDDFTLPSADTPVEKGEDLKEVEPAAEEKGEDLSADLFEMLIDPSENDNSEFESLLTGDEPENADDNSFEIEATDTEKANEIKADEGFDEFADLFVDSNDDKKEKEKPAEEEPVWDFDMNVGEDDDDMSSDNDFSDLLI